MIKKSVSKQIVKEFWFPFTIAVTWVVFGFLTSHGTTTVSAAIAQFSAAFFFLSWLTGQIFRVSKQVRTEQSFTSIETRVGGLIDSLAREAEALRGLATGGESFAYIIIGLHTPSAPTIFISHKGEYPLYGVSARMVDLQLFSALPQPLSLQDLASAEARISIGDMTPGYGVMVNPARALSGTARDYNIFFTGRNGGWTQSYRARLVEGVWYSATCVTRDKSDGNSTVLLAIRDQSFPVAELPKQWPADGEEVRSLESKVS